MHHRTTHRTHPPRPPTPYPPPPPLKRTKPPLKPSNSLPSPIIDIRLQLARNKARHAVTKPQAAQHGVVAFLVEEQLAAVAQAHVDLAVLVDVGRVAEGARAAREVEDAALADVDEEADVFLASIPREGGGWC